MLVLSRRLGEFLVINDNIFITVFEGGTDDKIKIAIDAPKDVKIARSETYEGHKDIQKKLDAIRSRKVDSKIRRLQNEMERLQKQRTTAPTE